MINYEFSFKNFEKVVIIFINLEIVSHNLVLIVSLLVFCLRFFFRTSIIYEKITKVYNPLANDPFRTECQKQQALSIAIFRSHFQLKTQKG